MNVQCWMRAVSLRKPKATAAMGTPRITASARTRRYCFERITVSGFGGAVTVRRSPSAGADASSRQGEAKPTSGPAGARRPASAEPFEEVVADAHGVGDRGQGRVHRADAREEARVRDVEVLQLVRLAVRVERRGVRVGPEPDGARLVGGGTDRHPLVQIQAVVEQVVLQAEVAEHALELAPQPLQA